MCLFRHHTGAQKICLCLQSECFVLGSPPIRMVPPQPLFIKGAKNLFVPPIRMVHFGASSNQNGLFVLVLHSYIQVLEFQIDLLKYFLHTPGSLIIKKICLWVAGTLVALPGEYTLTLLLYTLIVVE